MNVPRRQPERIGPRLVFAIGGTILLSFVAFYAVGFIGTLTPQTRIDSIVAQADGAHMLDPWENRDDDLFSECALLDMEITRDRSPLRDVAGTKFFLPDHVHPCDALRMHLGGTGEGTAPPVLKYFYGSRHVFAIAARFVDFQSVRRGLDALGILAPLAFGTAVLLALGAQALLFLPIVAVLLVGFGHRNLGSNLAHAPGFVVPLLVLSAIVALRPRLAGRNARFAAFALLASITVYFDIMTGALPCVLALALITNHFCFDARDESRAWLVNAGLLVATFLTTYALLVGLRLAVGGVVFHDNPVPEYIRSLAVRLSSSVDDHPIRRSEVISVLWRQRGISFSDASGAATLLYAAGAVSWIVAVACATGSRSGRRGVAVLAGASSVIALWYVVFPNHTYVHYAFMGRIAALVAAAGIAAAMLAGKRWMTGLALAIVLAVAACELVQSMLLMVRITDVAKVPDADIDVVGCSNDLAVGPDGHRDAVLRVRVEGPRFPPVALNALILERDVPYGAWGTEARGFPAAVLSREGRLLTGRDRQIAIDARGRRELLVAFCADGADLPRSRYALSGRTWLGKVSTPFRPLDGRSDP